MEIEPDSALASESDTPTRERLPRWAKALSVVGAFAILTPAVGVGLVSAHLKFTPKFHEYVRDTPFDDALLPHPPPERVLSRELGWFAGDVDPFRFAPPERNELRQCFVVQHGDEVLLDLQQTLAYMDLPGAAAAMLAMLTPDKSQEEQIYTVYCLRAIKSGWTAEQRQQLVSWFDRGWEMRGGASFEGHIEYLWQDTLKILPEAERVAAEQHKADVFKKRQEEALAKQMEADGKAKVEKSDLVGMGFQELAEYLEYDPGAYASSNAEDIVRGREVFERAKCATCHVFGTVGKGGGPDLSTVVARFRRRDILEAIMYPSKVVSDQYIGVTLELSDLSDVTGMIVSENDQVINLITSNGEKMEVKKADITKREDAKGSIMPEGLLSTMSMQELVALINFLERGGDTK